MSQVLHHEPWVGTSIQTYTGREFFPLDPQPEHIDSLDIAHALSLKCRYTGHCAWFYSVAQHSVVLCDYVREIGLSTLDQQWALMHDASEAYLPDVARPIKDDLPGFRAIEDRVMSAVAERYQLPLPMPVAIHKLDRLAYWRERLTLMKDVDWFRGHPQFMPVSEKVQALMPLPQWTWERARQEWWDRFWLLFPTELR